MKKRTATVIWKGTGKEGSGNITSQSKAVLNAHYSSQSRFEEGEGTNPEELLAAAHASCFTMKLAFVLDEAKFKAENIETTATVILENGTITDSQLSVKAKVPEISNEKFQKCVEEAKVNCPVSRALKINISLEAELLESLKLEIAG